MADEKRIQEGVTGGVEVAAGILSALFGGGQGSVGLIEAGSKNITESAVGSDSGHATTPVSNVSPSGVKSLDTAHVDFSKLSK